jgi:hypothetical protein
LACAIRGWLTAVPVLFALMMVNKESALIAIPALFAIIASQRGPRAAALWSAGLGVLGLAWLFHVRAAYANAPGTPRESWFWVNMDFWSNPRSYFMFTQAFTPALPSPRGANLLLLVLLAIPLRFGLPLVPRATRLAAIFTALILAPLFITSCYRDEVRNLSLLFPLLYVVASEGVSALFSAHAYATEERRQPYGGPSQCSGPARRVAQQYSSRCSEKSVRLPRSTPPDAPDSLPRFPTEPRGRGSLEGLPAQAPLSSR